MKKANRVKLSCSKHITGNVYDRFTTVVMASNKETTKNELKRQGYSVVEI